MLDTLEDPEELWDAIKCETLEAAKECIGKRRRSQDGFALVEMVESIEESRIGRLAVNRNQYRALLHRTRLLLITDKKRYVRGFTGDVKCHLNANDLRPAYRALKKTPLQVYIISERYPNCRWLPRIGRRWADGSLG